MTEDVKNGEKIDRKTDGWISDLAGALTDPVICHRNNLDQPPEKIKQAITLQRLLENVVAVKENRDPLGTDAECTWYLSTASLEFPFSEEWTRIYMYVFNKTMQFNETEVPADLRQDKLSDYEMGKLMDLKRWIYKIRAEHRKSEDRARRQEEKEQAKQEQETLQPKMFEF